MSDVVDVIFPEQGISLVAGPTGAGKTRWLVEMLMDWAAGKDVMGYKSHPRPWVYVSGDRSQYEVEATIKDLGIPVSSVPLYPAFGFIPPIGALGILDEAEKRKAELLVWEGFGSYVESNAGSTKVKSWLNMITWRLTHKHDGTPRHAPLTIIGVMEQPKMKPKDQYTNPRQRISGPAAWGHTAATVIIIDHMDQKKCRGPFRSLEIYPHQGGAEIIAKASLATGHFVIIP